MEKTDQSKSILGHLVHHHRHLSSISASPTLQHPLLTHSIVFSNSPSFKKQIDDILQAQVMEIPVLSSMDSLISKPQQGSDFKVSFKSSLVFALQKHSFELKCPQTHSATANQSYFTDLSLNDLFTAQQVR